MAAGRIKILHLITGLDTGGAEVSLLRLTGAMDPDRFENIVVSLTVPGPMSTAIRNQGIKVDAIHMSRSLPTPGALWRLYRLVRAERPDVLQTWLYHSDLIGLLTGRAARVPAIAWNIRCSYMGDEYQVGIKGGLVRLLARLSTYPDAIIANSHAGKHEHAALGYNPKRWEVLNNGFDLAAFRPHADARERLRHDLNLPDDAILIGLVARYDPIKNHEGFLRAAAELQSTDQEAHFVLVGGGVDGRNRDLNALIDHLDIRERVHLLGQRDDVPRLTAGLDIATCCSLGEGFPNVVGEAMACAVPCVVTDVGDAARIVGDTGIIVSAGDPQALARGWREMISRGAAGRTELGQQALARIESRFSLAHCVEKYQNFYDDLTERQNH
jgi:glycosyltransferase involved in cell wall biosynthesis